MRLSIIILTLFFGLSAFSAVDLNKSTIIWKATKKIGSGHGGSIKLKSAKAEINKKGEIVSGELVVDMNSIDVTDLAGKDRDKFLGHIKSDDFFSVDKHQTATLKITKQVDKDTVQGLLTIKGKTEPVSVDFQKNGNAYTGTFTFDRTRWGIIYGSGNFFKELAADRIINNEVTLSFNIVLN
jgi:polyisoprenoid-binding protein YceI